MPTAYSHTLYTVERCILSRGNIHVYNIYPVCIHVHEVVMLTRTVSPSSITIT